jgi:hypothetical protein
MAFRGKEMMKKVLKNIGGEKNLAPGMKESLKKCIPDSKVVMGRAKRGLYAGRHIQFGNRVSEDGGNKSVFLILSLSLSLSRFMFCSNLAHFLFLILIINEKN